VLAVALLILITLGFVAGIQTAGNGIISGISQPPDANIKIDAGQENARLVVMRSSNADRLEVLIDGEEITDGSGNGVLNPTAGSTIRLDWSGSASGRVVDVSSNVDPGSSLISVVAVDEPDNSVTVFSYEVPVGRS